MNENASNEQWLIARRELLAEEKALQAARDRVAEKRRALPWRKVDIEYRFDAQGSTVTLAQAARLS